MKRFVVLVGFVSMVACGAACSTTTGQPSPASASHDPTSGSGLSGSVPTSSGKMGSLPVDRPCSLLSSSDLRQIGVSSSPSQDKIGTAPSCETSNADDHIIVSIFANDGLSGLQASGPVHNEMIGSHQAKQEVDITGSCIIDIGVSNTSSVQVTTTPILSADPCPTALKVANLVEPKLP